MNTNEIIDEILRQIKQPLWENWYIKEKIGSGAFSAVYKVEAKRTSRRTSVSALKIEPITAEGTHFFDEQRKRNYIENKRRSAETEAEIMYNLRKCPYIVSYEEEDIKELHINGQFEGYYFLIRMEYLTAIASLIQKRSFDFSEKNIISLATDIGKGIMAAHRLGIIHRDIKLDNFFVDEFGVYKLGDFNISKKTGAARTFAGTPGYLAPEIYRAKSNIDECYTDQADIYSFGICLYQLTNELLFPFEDELDLDEAIDKRMSGIELPPPKCASKELAQIVLKACEFETEKRYASIEDFLDDLADIHRTKKSADVKQISEADSRPAPIPSPASFPVPSPASTPNPASAPVPTPAVGFKPVSPPVIENDNTGVNTVPAFNNEDIKRNEEIVQMQYDLKTNGEFLEFGSYYVAVDNPKTPLRWRILSIEDDKALIITFMGIDVKRFNDSKGDCTWENSSLREWLNNEFYNEAFNESEKKLIIGAELMNYKNVVYRTENGQKTKDNVFLLSIEEAERYFPQNNDRILKATAYARSKQVFVASNGGVWWWLRSSGCTESYAADVDYGGDVDSYGGDKYNSNHCVRPAVWINLAFLNENRRKNFKQSFINSHNHSFIQNVQPPINPIKEEPLFQKIKFGQYFRENEFVKEPLEWYVIKTESKKALLITAEIIDCLPYNQDHNFTTWENCYLRKWLNSYFMLIAFNDKEKKLIKSNNNNTADNPVYHTKGGKTVTDKVFLFSFEDALKSFFLDSGRAAKPTPFAVKKGLMVAENGCSWWLLRSPGNSQNYVGDVDYGGDIDFYGSASSLACDGLRPAVWVDIKALEMN